MERLSRRDDVKFNAPRRDWDTAIPPFPTPYGFLPGQRLISLTDVDARVDRIPRRFECSRAIDESQTSREQNFI